MSAVPSLSAIQRSNWCLLAALCVGLLSFSAQVALGCLVGGVLIGANLVVLSWFVQMVLRAALRGGKPSPWLALAPLKLLVLAAVAYLALWQLRLSPSGFALGISTPFLATLLEAARAALRRARLPAGLRA